MRPIERKSVQTISIAPEIELVVLGLLSFFTVQFFRMSSHHSPLFMWLDAIAFLLIPVGFFWLVSARLGNTGTSTQSRKLIYQMQAGAFLFAGLIFVVQWISRQAGLGDVNEIAVLILVQQVAWYLVVFSKFGTFERTAFLLSCTLVLFICFIAESNVVFVSAFSFAVIALWRLLGVYWKRVDKKALDVESKSLRVSGLAVLATVVLLSITGGVVWCIAPRNSTLNVSGFSFFSGGESGEEDLFARSGLGDGNMLTGGRNATTTGAVESDQFIEDDKPSIYDTMSDMFDGPKKIRKQNNRAVDPRTSAKHLEKVIKSEQSGKSFRTVRERPLPQKLDLKDKITNALFFVEGSVPARFSLDCYHHFDGWDWSKIDLDSEFMPKSTITVRNSMGKPWYRVNNVQREYLSQKRGHRVKIMRLSTDSLPASSLVDRWHIHRVDLPKMFRWNKQGIIRMDGDCIPSHTMIDVVSNVPNYHVLRSVKSLQRVDHPGETWTSIDIWLGVGSESGSSNDKFSVGDTDPDSPLLQIPENESKTKLGELVKNLTFGHREGWNQVEAIVNHFRNNYKHDPQLVASDEGIDSVKSFLKNGGGPSYLFASTTAQALRSAGYRTRLVSGFLVENDDFDRRANQSIVTKENLHMWPEVCLDGWHWLPVEPTPGFPIPYSHQTMWQIVKSNVIALIKLMVRHPIQTILLTGLLSLCLRYRREVTVLGSWLMWMAILLAFPGRRLTATRQMLDVRFWAAGIPRPSFATISDWSFHVNAGADNEFFEYWKFVNFSNRPTNDKRKEIKLACRKVSEDLSFEKIKQFAKQFAKAGSKSC